MLIWATGLRKAYGAFEAVRGIDLAIRRGDAFGLLGPNGAGKSSTMRMLAAVSAPSGGSLEILGLDPARHGPGSAPGWAWCPRTTPSTPT